MTTTRFAPPSSRVDIRLILYATDVLRNAEMGRRTLSKHTEVQGMLVHAPGILGIQDNKL